MLLAVAVCLDSQCCRHPVHPLSAHPTPELVPAQHGASREEEVAVVAASRKVKGVVGRGRVGSREWGFAERG